MNCAEGFALYCYSFIHVPMRTHRVIQVAMSAGSGECVPVYGSRSEKIAHRGATLATLGKIWDHYGFRYVLSCTIRQS